jgi:hypothetical protein
MDPAQLARQVMDALPAASAAANNGQNTIFMLNQLVVGPSTSQQPMHTDDDLLEEVMELRELLNEKNATIRRLRQVVSEMAWKPSRAVDDEQDDTMDLYRRFGELSARARMIAAQQP